MNELTIESGSNADNHVIYAHTRYADYPDFPLQANVEGVDIKVTISQSAPDAVKVILNHKRSARQYESGIETFDPVKIDSLPIEFHEFVKINHYDQ